MALRSQRENRATVAPFRPGPSAASFVIPSEVAESRDLREAICWSATSAVAFERSRFFGGESLPQNDIGKRRRAAQANRFMESLAKTPQGGLFAL